jgi:lactoylglutathione lyase
MKARLVYTGIRVKNMDRSVRFYTETLGMKLRGRAKNRAVRGEWAQLESPVTHQLLELNWYSPRSPFHTRWRRGVELDHLCFRVPDLDDAMKELERAGAGRVGGPYATPGWKMVDVRDPNGICLELGAPVRGPRRHRR